MDKRNSKILLNVVCAVLAIVFAVFLAFAFSIRSVAFIVIAAILLVTVVICWIAAGRQSKTEEAEMKEDPTLDNVLPKAFRREITESLKQRDRLEEKTANISAVFKKAFADSTISYDKFMAGVDKAKNAVLDNQKDMARRIFLFDDQGYAAARKKGQAYKAYEDTKAYLDAKMAENEQLLAGIDKLAGEAGEISEDANQRQAALDTLSELVHDTEYYKEKETH